MNGETVLTRDDVRLAVRSDGPPDAQTLLCCNSLGTGMELWDPQIPAWSAQRRVIRFDQRGHGGSEAPPALYRIDDLGRDALAVLDAYEVERADLCGLSLGGVVALWVAIHHPHRVRRLVLACTAAKVGTEESWRGRAEAVLSGGTTSIADMVMERFFSADFRDREPQAVADARGTLIDLPDEGYLGCCLALSTADLRGELDQVSAPTLVLAGGADEATPPEVMRELYQGLPDARWHELEGVGHLANLEAPDAFARAVLDHLTDEVT